MPKSPKPADRVRLKSTDRRLPDRPEWEPLLALVGTELTCWFAWVGVVELSDGAIVQTYKHEATRAYAMIALDGRTFFYDWDGTTTDGPAPDYMQIPRHTAIAWAFRGWGAGDRDPQQARERAELDRAYDYAERDEPMPVDPNELRLQREFEARQGRAA